MDEPQPTPPKRMGPLVRRPVHAAGAIMIVVVVQFVAAMIVAQLKFPNPPGYSAFGNPISDLGNPDLTSWAWIFNLSVLILGAFGIIAVILVRSAFPDRRSSKAGLFLLGLALFGAILVGVFPENASELSGNIHSVVTDLAFIASALALLVLSAAMIRDTRWAGYRFYTFVSGVVTLVAIILASFNLVGALGVGGMERLIIAPTLLWGIVAGIHVLRLPAYAPRVPRVLVPA